MIGLKCRALNRCTRVPLLKMRVTASHNSAATRLSRRSATRVPPPRGAASQVAVGLRLLRQLLPVGPPLSLLARPAYLQLLHLMDLLLEQRDLVLLETPSRLRRSPCRFGSRSSAKSNWPVSTRTRWCEWRSRESSARSRWASNGPPLPISRAPPPLAPPRALLLLLQVRRPLGLQWERRSKPNGVFRCASRPPLPTLQVARFHSAQVCLIQGSSSIQSLVCSHRMECSNRLLAASAAEIRELMRGVQLPPQSTPEWAARFSDQQLLERVRSANAPRAADEPSAASDSASSPTSRPLWLHSGLLSYDSFIQFSSCFLLCLQMMTPVSLLCSWRIEILMHLPLVTSCPFLSVSEDYCESSQSQ